MGAMADTPNGSAEQKLTALSDPDNVQMRPVKDSDLTPAQLARVKAIRADIAEQQGAADTK